eukprot:5559730-Pyramimonas_sp.AAC.2
MYEFVHRPVVIPREPFDPPKKVEAVAAMDCKPTNEAMVVSESSALGLTDKHMAMKTIACHRD